MGGLISVKKSQTDLKRDSSEVELTDSVFSCTCKHKLVQFNGFWQRMKSKQIFSSVETMEKKKSRPQIFHTQEEEKEKHPLQNSNLQDKIKN